ncbi:2-oxoacid:acceptor oxidoreductase family protein [Candidatus Bathyarchaeota archaeon]|nr:2-oxoacid:acceptor oxidoreductase family protein [Candidatus Bathyarchaeota archaeon]
MRTEILIAGFGGQGIVRTGLMLAMAACIYGGKNAIQSQSYGPESRGGRCKSEVIIADGEIDFPKVEKPEILIILSQDAYNEYVDTLKDGGILLVDPDMVPYQKRDLKARVFEIPATKIAENLGKKIVANVVMIGAFTAITGLLDVEAVKESIRRNVPRGTEQLNLTAFEKGYEYGRNCMCQIKPIHRA